MQTRIDAKVKARAVAVLEEIGMTVSDAALADPRPPIAHERVKKHFAGRRAAASKKVVG